ncbi:Thiamine-monophosphate kinase [Mucinivorans hirudinis]|uniref:Thiamine-monophosphate kinase n=1 Tax=Mucinivorans hirudinis TaxID=1433126 RepID=A0A060R605_9BACT|nr:Thiamine-monophosphate kinase [Mucinivorans hirudinis]
MTQLSEIGEFGLIATIAKNFAELIPHECSGIGDDCAIIPIGKDKSLVVTTDMLVEDVHFLRDRITSYELGYKSLAVNLSDIAAMGALPHSTFLSISLPSDISIEWCEGFFAGYRAHNVALLGGDTTKSTEKITINVTAIGTVDNENIKLRKGAKAGDKIYVTSTLGDSAGGLQSILQNRPNKELIKAHNLPRPHIAEGLELSVNKNVTAMMDISDGLASDIRHILEASNVGAKIELSKIPISNTLLNSGLNAMELALTGGEDYCLLFCAAPDAEFAKYRQIGEITSSNICKIVWCEHDIPTERSFDGFTHF